MTTIAIITVVSVVSSLILVIITISIMITISISTTTRKHVSLQVSSSLSRWSFFRRMVMGM